MEIYFCVQLKMHDGMGLQGGPRPRSGLGEQETAQLAWRRLGRDRISGWWSRWRPVVEVTAGAREPGWLIPPLMEERR